MDDNEKFEVIQRDDIIHRDPATGRFLPGFSANPTGARPSNLVPSLEKLLSKLTKKSCDHDLIAETLISFIKDNNPVVALKATEVYCSLFIKLTKLIQDQQDRDELTAKLIELEKKGVI